MLFLGLFLQSSASVSYQEGREALDRSDWQGAVEAFEQVSEDDAVADAAIFWQAYAYNKLRDADRALESVALLERRFPNSEWRDDAQALAAEIRGRASGEDDNDELRLMALNALMHADDEEAIPILEEFLRGAHSERLKERALFVLAQSGSARGFEVVAEAARSSSSPNLQKKAIRYLGVHESERSLDLLVELYGSITDMDARRSILQSFMIAGQRDRLLGLAREEPNEELRARAIRLLGTMDAEDELWTLYEQETSEEIRKQILRAFMVAGDQERLLAVAKNAAESLELRKSAIHLLGTQDADEELWALYQQVTSEELKERVMHALFISGNSEKLLLVARDKDESIEMRRRAIHNLGITGEASRPMLLELYQGETAFELKEQILHALFVQDSAPELVELARSENDLELEKKAVHWLSLMDAPEAKAYMMEILRR
ncbi:MAG: hypothetical protein E2P02_11085 [Acidobacteria bacterium]|nr:MAG: hypothetical protein E2P02_11085 [Acidobacteriota bacterium]